MLASVSLVDGNWREPKGVDVMWLPGAAIGGI
jgi:hypothetical protein